MLKSSAIWALVVPIILSNITVPLIGAVDTAVMGHMEHAAYMGAVAIGGLIFDYIYWGFGFLRLSTTGLAGQALGRDDTVAARGVLVRAGIIALVGGLFLWVVQGVIFGLAAYLIEASPEVEELAKTYFAIRIWSAPAALMNYVLIGWLLAAKDAKGVLLQQVIANLINLVLDIWFVTRLHMGVDGVAWASVAAQYGGLLVGLFLMSRHLRKLGGGWARNDIFELAKMKRLMSMNSDLFIRTVCLLSAFAWFTSQGAKMGDVTLAANAVLMHFLMFTSYGLDGFAHAVEVLGAHGAGRKDHAMFQDAFRKTTIYAAFCAFVYALGYFVFGDWLVGLFSDLPDVVATAKTYLVWMWILPLISVWSFQLDGVFMGLTQTDILRNMMVLSLVLYIPLSLIFMFLWGNHGLWAAFTFFMGLRAITLGMNVSKVKSKVFS